MSCFHFPFFFFFFFFYVSVVDFSRWEANESVYIRVITELKITVDCEMFGKNYFFTLHMHRGTFPYGSCGFTLKKFDYIQLYS